MSSNAGVSFAPGIQFILFLQYNNGFFGPKLMVPLPLLFSSNSISESVLRLNDLIDFYLCVELLVIKDILKLSLVFIFSE